MVVVKDPVPHDIEGFHIKIIIVSHSGRASHKSGIDARARRSCMRSLDLKNRVVQETDMG